MTDHTPLIVLRILDAYLTNNELRHDMNKGQALSKGGAKAGVPAIYDLAEAIMAEGERRAQPSEFSQFTVTPKTSK